MNFRITTNMVKNSYQYNLQKSTRKMSDARDMVMTQRTFSSYAEDPAAASLSFRLRRSWYQTSNYLANTKDVYSKFNTAWHNLAGVVEDLSDATGRVASIRGVTDTAGESRSALAVVLRETAESVVQAMNQKLGDHFIFAGNDALKAPFSWSDDKKTLYYRGVNVNAGAVKKPAERSVPSWVELDDNGELDVNKVDPNKVPTSSNDDYEQAWIDYYNDQVNNGVNGVPKPSDRPLWAQDLEKGSYVLDDFGTPDVEAIKAANGGTLSAADEAWLAYYQDQSDVKKLQAMSGEEMYIDLGMGATESSPNNPVRGTYFNSALCGLDFLGCGVDADGDPKNLALIMKELAGVFETWGENGQMYLPEEYRDMSYEKIQAILKSEDPDDMARAAEITAYNEEYRAKAERLMDKLKAAQEHTTEKWVELDAHSVYLQTAESRLTTQATDLNIQFLDVEQMDMADAITNFSYQMTCYNAALKIGTQLLSQSLIDYMN